MHKLLKALYFTLIALSLCACNGKEDLTSYVDPRIGTAHSRWFFFTPSAVPFGMAKPAPTTNGHYGNASGWQAIGYDYRDSTIEGFANFHEFQVGGVVIAPTTGELQTVPGELSDPESGYRSRFDKESEHAHPGYYSVILKDYDILAELTATDRVAFHRYTFLGDDKCKNLVFNIGTKMGESGRVLDSEVSVNEDGTVEGWVTTEPAYIHNYQRGADLTMYFSAVTSSRPTITGTFINDSIQEGSHSANGAGAGAYLTFNEVTDVVEVKVGLSYTSVENARANMKAEASHMDFDKAAKIAHRRWEKELDKIRVEGGKYEDRVKFYTGLYHALLGRGLASDINGAYPAHDGSIGQIPLGKDGKPIHNHYNTDAIWGGFWNLTQLWSLAWPEYYADWISSQLLVYKDSGWLADGIACSRYVSGVGTNFTSLAIAAAYNCGIRDFDVDLGYEAAYKNETASEGRPAGAGKLDVGLFVEKGYSPYSQEYYMKNTPEGSGFAASHTLEYSFSSYAVAQMARSLGHEEDYKKLSALSEGWKYLFDQDSKLMRPRGFDGEFLEDFNPYEPWIGFQEGNAVQYTYYVPHHIEQLVEMVGKEEFCTRLDSTFIISRENIFGGGKTVDAFSGLHTYYNHGNQPNLHISALFNFAGKPWLSQKWMRTICNEFYGTEGIHGYGYGQDEDQGQLGAWYVMASIGLFDAKGLVSPDPSFQIGAPLFDKIEITLNGNFAKGKKFTIEASGNSEESLYIESMNLNGKPWDSVFLPYDEIMNGGDLKIGLSSVPNHQITQ